MRMQDSIPSLQGPELLPIVKECVERGSEGQGYRLVLCAIHPRQLHLLLEAVDTRGCIRAVQGLAIRLARHVNRALNRRGKLFADRYLDELLRSPQEVTDCVTQLFVPAPDADRSQAAPAPCLIVLVCPHSVLLRQAERLWT